MTAFHYNIDANRF